MIDNEIVKGDLDDMYSRKIPWDKLNNKAVLLSAPYGMLSSYVTAMLIFLNEIKGYNIKIIALGRSEHKLRRRFGDYVDKEYFSFVQSDLSDFNINIPFKVDYIFHMASHASGNFFKDYPVDVIKPNVVGTISLLELARKNNSEGFLFFSSGDVYGKVKSSDILTENKFGEMDPLDGHSCYGESKRMAETICDAYYRQFGVPIRIARIFPTYAPTMDIDNDPRAIASFMKNLVYGENIIMKSDGQKVMYYCYIADAVAAYYSVLLDGKNGEAYNVGNNDEMFTIKDLAELLVSFRNDVELKVITKPREKGEAYVENRFQSAIKPDLSKIRNLGWTPHFSTAEGFKRVYMYYTAIQK